VLETFPKVWNFRKGETFQTMPTFDEMAVSRCKSDFDQQINDALDFDFEYSEIDLNIVYRIQSDN